MTSFYRFAWTLFFLLNLGLICLLLLMPADVWNPGMPWGADGLGWRYATQTNYLVSVAIEEILLTALTLYAVLIVRQKPERSLYLMTVPTAYFVSNYFFMGFF